MIRNIVMYGNAVLRTKGKRVERFDAELRALATDMFETMYQANGIGLAAQQVGEPLKLTVIDISEAETRPSQMWIDGDRKSVV